VARRMMSKRLLQGCKCASPCRYDEGRQWAPPQYYNQFCVSWGRCHSRECQHVFHCQMTLEVWSDGGKDGPVKVRQPTSCTDSGWEYCQDMGYRRVGTGFKEGPHERWCCGRGSWHKPNKCEHSRRWPHRPGKCSPPCYCPHVGEPFWMRTPGPESSLAS
jgi:hypothetical protein